MTQKSAIHLIAAALALGLIALSPAPAQARQNNFCTCVPSEGSPCTCTKNWKISPWATHTYTGGCDIDGDGTLELIISSKSVDVNDPNSTTHLQVTGRGKYTSCDPPYGLCRDCVMSKSLPDLVTIQCTNWGLTKKDSTSTVVTCKKQ